ncbi:MAG: ABC transporter ATP-binding protein [Candidatus Dojkabacteria bacterium]|nr:ABC transporter ATP-binding protein [Candidatus Dojkabacteria bacterium]MDQ7021023.1 ABC transporter ATP-binding protein [Candidatus Dojkabacteria bacterium]
MNLDIYKNEKLAIVGASGSGKSTLTKLLMKLYLPDDGVININDLNVLDIKNDSLLGNIKVVPQANELLSRSIKDNLQLVSDIDLSDKEVVDALELSDAMNFISMYEDGIHQLIGSKGKQLSGGETQRICIARALVTKPEILILDEATASLDTVTEKNIYKSLSELHSTAMIAITHRISSGPFFDRIVVMDKGEIIGTGHHDELIKNNEVYQRLWEASKH